MNSNIIFPIIVCIAKNEYKNRYPNTMSPAIHTNIIENVMRIIKLNNWGMKNILEVDAKFLNSDTVFCIVFSFD